MTFINRLEFYAHFSSNHPVKFIDQIMTRLINVFDKVKFDLGKFQNPLGEMGRSFIQARFQVSS